MPWGRPGVGGLVVRGVSVFSYPVAGIIHLLLIAATVWHKAFLPPVQRKRAPAV